VAGATTAEYRRDGDITTARECRTQFLAPPLAGQVLGYYKGRIYVGDSDILWASGAYKYELFDLRHDYVGFDSEIVAFAAVDDGVYIGTERDIWFLGGNDFSTFKARQVINYGAIFGAVTYGDPGKVWMGTREGVCLLENGGEVKNVTRDHYHYDPGLTGAMLYHHSRGIPRVLVSLRGDAMHNYDAYKYGDEHTLTIADSTSSNTADNISTEV
jgi:hypothetical protein